MAVLIRVAPWLAFLAGQLLLGNTGASLFATVACLIIVVALLARGARPAELILDGSSLAYFALFTVLGIAWPHSWLMPYVAAGAQLFHAVLITAFLAMGTPFTLPIARRGVPAEVGESQEFRRFNVLLTLIWLAGFVISGVLMVALMLAGIRMTWLQITLVAISIIVPTVVQRRMIAAGEARLAAADPAADPAVPGP